MLVKIYQDIRENAGEKLSRYEKMLVKVAKILEKMLVKSCQDMRENAGEKSRYKRKCW